MITIEKAIKDLQARVDGEFCIKGVDNCEDMKLGIEALKFRKGENEAGYLDLDDLLPGETKD